MEIGDILETIGLGAVGSVGAIGDQMLAQRAQTQQQVGQALDWAMRYGNMDTRNKLYAELIRPSYMDTLLGQIGLRSATNPLYDAWGKMIAKRNAQQVPAESLREPGTTGLVSSPPPAAAAPAAPALRFQVPSWSDAATGVNALLGQLGTRPAPAAAPAAPPVAAPSPVVPLPVAPPVAAPPPVAPPSAESLREQGTTGPVSFPAPVAAPTAPPAAPLVAAPAVAPGAPLPVAPPAAPPPAAVPAADWWGSVLQSLGLSPSVAPAAAPAASPSVAVPAAPPSVAVPAAPPSVAVPAAPPSVAAPAAPPSVAAPVPPAAASAAPGLPLPPDVPTGSTPLSLQRTLERSYKPPGSSVDRQIGFATGTKSPSSSIAMQPAVQADQQAAPDAAAPGVPPSMQHEDNPFAGLFDAPASSFEVALAKEFAKKAGITSQAELSKLDNLTRMDYERVAPTLEKIGTMRTAWLGSPASSVAIARVYNKIKALPKTVQEKYQGFLDADPSSLDVNNVNQTERSVDAETPKGQDRLATPWAIATLQQVAKKYGIPLIGDVSKASQREVRDQFNLVLRQAGIDATAERAQANQQIARERLALAQSVAATNKMLGLLRVAQGAERITLSKQMFSQSGLNQARNQVTKGMQLVASIKGRQSMAMDATDAARYDSDLEGAEQSLAAAQTNLTAVEAGARAMTTSGGGGAAAGGGGAATKATGGGAAPRKKTAAELYGTSKATGGAAVPKPKPKPKPKPVVTGRKKTAADLYGD